ncbi:MAG TPA: DegT/DnrJ/EryC1/StrS family aminotransferase, partial [Spirochaetia bacterium]|nr:DegT/DnrJ/EryC1/StrS family aminotransferase [Spirochaetia bacterium]
MNRSTDFIPFAKPSIGPREEDAVMRVLRSGWLTTGAETRSFEEEFRSAVGAKHALAVNSATAGLHLAVDAAGIGAGDRVAMSPYTFASTAEVVRYVGADPLFVDIARDSYNVDANRLADALGREGRIRAVIPVHIAGDPCDMDRIIALAREYKLPVIEDAAHGFPAKSGDRILGTLGAVGVYSFYATKTITTGEGGMIVTDDDGLARRMSTMRLHGIDREIWDRYSTRGASWRYEVVEPGYKYNMTDIAAAMGRVQLARTDEFHRRRIAIATRYDDAFAGRDYLRLPPRHDDHSWHLYIIRVVSDRLSISRDEFIEELAEAGIGTSVHF